MKYAFVRINKLSNFQWYGSHLDCSRVETTILMSLANSLYISFICIVYRVCKKLGSWPVSVQNVPNISQGSVVAHLKCDSIFNDDFTCRVAPWTNYENQLSFHEATSKSTAALADSEWTMVLFVPPCRIWKYMVITRWSSYGDVHDDAFFKDAFKNKNMCGSQNDIISPNYCPYLTKHNIEGLMSQIVLIAQNYMIKLILKKNFLVQVGSFMMSVVIILWDKVFVT